MKTRSPSAALFVTRILAPVALIITLALMVFPSVANAKSMPADVHARQSHSRNPFSTLRQSTSDAVKQVAFTQDGTGWLVLHGDNGYSSHGLPTKMVDRLDALNTAGNVIQWVSFAPDGGWLISYDTGFASVGLPTDANSKLKELNNNGSNVTWAEFAQDGSWVFIYDSYGYSSSGLGKGIVAELDKLNTAQTPIKTIALAPDGTWVIIDDDNGWVASTGVDTKITDLLDKLNTAGTTITQMEFTSDGTGWIILSGDNSADGENLPDALASKLTELTPAVLTTPTTPLNRPTPHPGKPTPGPTKSFNS